MNTSAGGGVFSLRFKDRRTKAALQHLAEQTGQSMTEVVNRAIEHEVVRQGADLERRLEEALHQVQNYTPERDAETYIAAVAAGERSGQEPFRDVREARARPAHEERRASQNRPTDALGALSGFQRH